MRAGLRRILRVLRFLAASAIVLALLALGAFWAAVWLWPYPQGIERMPAPSVRVFDRDGAELAALASRDEQWHIPLSREQVNPHLLHALVAVEDHRFHAHRGIDYRSIAGAAWENLGSLRVRRGASTITMQLHRLRDPAPRSLWGKFEQAVRARQLEQLLSKDEILLEYINRAPFGGNLVGAGAAAWRYFGKDCRDLTLAEAALLAGLPQSPTRLRPDRHPDAARARRDLVLLRMRQLGYITVQQCDAAQSEPVRARWIELPQQDSAAGALATLMRLTGHEPRVDTTLDRRIQRRSHHAAERALESLRASGIASAAVVVLDTQTAECLARVSIDDEHPALDLTARRRSSGSALKPFIYAAAFDDGVSSPQSRVRDLPANWAGYAPENFDRTFHGVSTAAEALAESRNIPAMALLARVGVDRTSAIMRDCGLRGLAGRRYGLSLAIGGAEVSPLELAEAYATLGRGGRPVRAGTVAGAAFNPGADVFSARACAQVLEALGDPDRTASVHRSAVPLHIAWKTGTSSGNRDAWCAAVTARLTLVVWLGNASGGGSAALVGQHAAAPLALELMASLDPRCAEAPATAEAARVSVRKPAGPSPLAIVSPSPDQRVIVVNDVALAQQQVRLLAGSRGVQPRGAPAKLWWFIDGAMVGSCDAGQVLWWTPSPGPHTARVVDANGRAAEVRFRVDAE